MSKMDLSRFSDLLGDLPNGLAAEGLPTPLATSGRNSSSQPSGGQAIEPQEAIPAIADESQMARLLGVTANRVRTLQRDGLLAKAGPGRWDVRASLGLYLERLRTIAARAGAPAAGGGDSDQLRAEKLRLTRAQADGQELKNRTAAGELVPIADVRIEWVTAATDLRAQILAIPARVAARAGLSRDAAATLEQEIRLALEELRDER